MERVERDAAASGDAAQLTGRHAPQPIECVDQIHAVNPTEVGRLCQPHMEGWRGYAVLMSPADPKTVLWTNVLALMQHHYGRENLSKLAREAKIGPGSATRIKEQQTSVGLDVLEKVADCFGLEPWHLLIVGLDPMNPPVGHLTRQDAAKFEKLRDAARELAA